MTVKRALLLSAVALMPFSPQVAAAAPRVPDAALQAPQGVASAAATEQGAEQLTEVLQRYLGRSLVGATKFVSVTPQGSGYKLQADLARLKMPGETAPFAIKADPLVALLNPQPDGTWHVTSEGLPTFSITGPDQASTLSYDGFRFDGVFDPKIAGFRTATTTSSGMTLQGVSPKATVNVRNTGQSRYTQTVRDNDDGTVTTELAQAITDFAYQMTTMTPGATAAQPATAFSVSAHAPKVTGSLTVANSRPTRLMDLWAFLAAHPSKAMLVADQAQLKGILSSLLPPAAFGSGEADIHELAIDGTEGSIKFGELFERLAIGGSEAENGVGLHVRIAGMELPQGLVPPWAESLVPTGLDLDTTVGPVRFNEALLKLVAAFDLGTDPILTGEQSADIVQTFGAPGAIVMTLRPSTITTPLLTLKLQGAGHYDAVVAKPVGAILVTAVGLDHAIDAMAVTAKQAVEAGQLLQGLVFLKQIALPEADGTFSWRVESTPDGNVLVNGKAIDGLAGGRRQPAMPEPVPESEPAPDSKP